MWCCINSQQGNLNLEYFYFSDFVVLWHIDGWSGGCVGPLDGKMLVPYRLVFTILYGKHSDLMVQQAFNLPTNGSSCLKRLSIWTIECYKMNFSGAVHINTISCEYSTVCEYSIKNIQTHVIMDCHPRSYKKPL
jgi:hypothetical protein